MTETELKEILDKHKKWLNGEDGGERAVFHYADLHYADLHNADLRNADLRDADLRGVNLSDADLGGADLSDANLSGANLSGVNLRDADLRGVNFSEANLCCANFDYSCLPLWCGLLHAHFDDRQIIQILYHAVKAGTESPNVSDNLKEVLWGLADTANKFHRVKQCGRIEK